MAATISPRGEEVIAWSYAMFAIAALVVLLRFYVRIKMIKMVGREDIMIAISLALSLIQSVFMHQQVSSGGLGLHYDTLTPTQLYHFNKTVYLTIILYNLSLCATKFSVLFLCLRIFNVYPWHKVCYAVVGLLSLYTIWVTMSSIIPCFPIRSQWDPTVAGRCLPLVTIWTLNAALNVVTDFLVVMLPIPAIVSLQLPRKQKIGVTFIFALGFFICIISIIRIFTLRKNTRSSDPSYDNCSIAIWSVVEVNAAIVGACLPTLNPLIRRAFPNLLSSFNTDNRPYYPQSKSGDRTVTTTCGGSTGGNVLSGTTPENSKARNTLDDADDVALREMDGDMGGADDARSEATTERSMYGWRRADDAV